MPGAERIRLERIAIMAVTKTVEGDTESTKGDKYNVQRHSQEKE